MNTTPSNVILHMDDDADDVEMLQQAINEIGTSFQIQSVSDGKQGLEQLLHMKQKGRLPRLIVLDINMPGLDGKMTYVKIKEDPALASIPVVIFSTSNSALDKMFFQSKNVEYISKPVRFDELVSIAKRLLAFAGE